ncbi:MAG: hypothetical protein R3B72_51245 [Polyangiaceae bacterium]
MGYRDEVDALRARVDQLEDELANREPTLHPRSPPWLSRWVGRAASKELTLAVPERISDEDTGLVLVEVAAKLGCGGRADIRSSTSRWVVDRAYGNRIYWAVSLERTSDRSLLRIQYDLRPLAWSYLGSSAVMLALVASAPFSTLATGSKLAVVAIGVAALVLTRVAVGLLLRSRDGILREAARALLAVSKGPLAGARFGVAEHDGTRAEVAAETEALAEAEAEVEASSRRRSR